MINKGILKPEEVSTENFMEIAKIIHRYESILYKIKSARLDGDYAYEKAFFRDGVQKGYEVVKKERNTEKPCLKLNELIEYYCSTQMKDGVWKPYTLADHKTRLENITYILGNKLLTEINREDMRLFSDILEKMPPACTKINKFKSLSWEEIVESRPAKTLSIKTVNVIIQGNFIYV